MGEKRIMKAKIKEQSEGEKLAGSINAILSIFGLLVFVYIGYWFVLYVDAWFEIIILDILASVLVLWILYLFIRGLIK